MFDYIVWYDEKNKKFLVKTKDENGIKESNISDRGPNMLVFSDYISEGNANKMARFLNKLLEVDKDIPTIKVRKCKTCGKYFILTKSEQDWYTMKNFKFPKKCRLCKEKEKETLRYNNLVKLCEEISDGKSSLAEHVLRISGIGSLDVKCCSANLNKENETMCFVYVDHDKTFTKTIKLKELYKLYYNDR